MDARTHAFRLYGSVDAKAGRLEQSYSIAMASHPTEVLALSVERASIALYCGISVI